MSRPLHTANREPLDIVGSAAYIRQDAANTLWNMSIIAEADMMQRGVYVDEEIENVERAQSGAICGGHRACAVGSLFLGAKVPMTHYGGEYDEVLTEEEVKDLIARKEFWGIRSAMPNTSIDSRGVEFRKRPYLGLAYRALNNAAMGYMAKHRPEDLSRWLATVPSPFEGPDCGWAEWLFESSFFLIQDLGDIFVQICDTARGRVLAGYYSDNLSAHGFSSLEN